MEGEPGLMIKIFFGEDTFRSHEALEELRREVEAGDALGGVSTEIDGASAEPEELLNASQTMPLLGGQRLIIVRGLLGRFEGRRGSRRKKAKDDDQATSPLGDWQQVVDSLPSLPESTLLVFVDGKLGARNPMLTAVRKSADVQQFDGLAKGELAGWIAERAELYGARLEGRATAAMADLIGGDLWTIDSELRKLATYADGSAVSEETVRELVSQVREANAFALADAIVEGRADAAIKLFQQRLADGDSPLRLLALIARQYRLIIQAKELQAQNVRPTEIGKRLGIHSFVAQRVLQQAPPYSIEQLRAAYARLLEADLSIKRGIYNDETALELLIFELATSLASRRSGRQGYNRPQAGQSRAPSAAATGSPGTR
jgi:DNA polymerase-3 subunit delta